MRFVLQFILWIILAVHFPKACDVYYIAINLCSNWFFPKVKFLANSIKWPLHILLIISWRLLSTLSTSAALQEFPGDQAHHSSLSDDEIYTFKYDKRVVNFFSVPAKIKVLVLFKKKKKEKEWGLLLEHLLENWDQTTIRRLFGDRSCNNPSVF